MKQVLLVCIIRALFNTAGSTYAKNVTHLCTGNELIFIPGKPNCTYQGPIETSPQVTAQGLKGLCKQQHIIVKNSVGKLPAYYNEYICYSGDVQHRNANGNIEKLEQYTLPLRAGCEIGLL